MSNDHGRFPPDPPPNSLSGLSLELDLTDDERKRREAPRTPNPAVPMPAPSAPTAAPLPKPVAPHPGGVPQASSYTSDFATDSAEPLGEVVVESEAVKRARELAKQLAEKSAVAGKQVSALGAEMGREIAGHSRALAAKSIGANQPKVIRLEDPSTWLKPMMGPLIALAAAMFLSIIAVIVQKVTDSQFSLSFISVPLLLGAIGFGVVRWIKLQQD